MRASRLLSLLLHLQARGRVTASEMAAALEVSVRTIYRDIDQLSAANIPVIADRGRTGGFQLVAGFRTHLAGLSEAEAETLFFAGLPGPAQELGLAELLAVTRTKLLGALPANARAERVATRFHLDASGWFRASEPVPLLPTVAQAVWGTRLIKIRYGSAQSSVLRTLGPAGLVLKAGLWYLVAQSGNAFRTYRVARILEAQPLEQAYERPSDFDLAAHWTRSAREYELSNYPDQAVIRLSPRGRTLMHLLGPYVENAVLQSASAPDAAGWVRCTIPMEAGDAGIRELLRLGAEVEVLSPAALRRAMREALRAMLQRYPERTANRQGRTRVRRARTTSAP